jgi:DNA-binding SARP family transcriptional activator
MLMNVFWPDVEAEAARRNLHQAIYSLRQTLRREDKDFQHILYENDRYFLNPKMTTWIDCEEFENHAQAGQRLEVTGQSTMAIAEYSVAESLYQGGFLIEDVYEEWANPRRERIKNLYLHVADRLSHHYMQREEYSAALVLCQKILSQDNCHEASHRRIMRCYLAQAQRHLAIRQYQTCTQVLSEELELAPSPETTALYQRITKTR